MAILQSYAQMLPRLQAEESLMQITVATTGSGFSGDSGKDAIRALERQAKGLPPIIKEEDKGMPLGQQFAASLGIPIRVHKKKVVEQGA